MPKIVDHQHQRRAIADEAAAWIANHGLEAFTLRSIAQAHGCSKGMVQHYFANKEELLSGALLSVTERYAERAKSAEAALTGIARVEARLRAILPLNPELRGEWVVRMAFYVRAAHVPGMQHWIAKHVAAALREAVGDLREGQREGTVRTGIGLPELYRGVIATVAGIAVSEIVSPNQISPAAQKRLLRNALAILRPPSH